MRPDAACANRRSVYSFYVRHLFAARDAPRDDAERVARMRYLLISLAFLFEVVHAAAQVLAPSPESDLGLASLAMVAAAAFLAYRLRRRCNAGQARPPLRDGLKRADP